MATNKAMAVILPKYVESVHMIIRVSAYFPIRLSFGVCSSNCPNKILPAAYTILTIATSNQSDSVAHITLSFALFF